MEADLDNLYYCCHCWLCSSSEAKINNVSADPSYHWSKPEHCIHKWNNVALTKDGKHRLNSILANFIS